MDPATLDPSTIPVGGYEEDPDEEFLGPAGLADFFNEDGVYEDDGEEEYYDGDGSQEPEPLEHFTAQRGNPTEVSQVETVSGHTQELLPNSIVAQQ